MDSTAAKQYNIDTKYCLLCKKNETRDECSWGPKMWDKYTTDKLDVGEEKDHEVAMAQSQLSSAAKDIKTLQKRLGKKEKNIPAWMQAKITDTEHNMDAAAGYTKKEEFVLEKKKGLWDNIHARRKKGLPPKKPGQEGYPKTLNVEGMSMKDFMDARKKRERSEKRKELSPTRRAGIHNPEKKPERDARRDAAYGETGHGGALRPNKVRKAKAVGELTKEGVLTYKEFMTEVAAWQRKEGKNREGGLNEKGRKSYERENPGSDLKAPSKKVGNPRRASFCARMSGMKKKLTSKKTANDPNSRINKSLRAWNC